jgi:protease PrsW
VRDSGGQALAYVNCEDETGPKVGGETAHPRRGAADRDEHRKAAQMVSLPHMRLDWKNAQARSAGAKRSLGTVGALARGNMFLLSLAPAAIVAAAIAPALLLLWLVVAADSRPEPPAVVWTAFVLGALSIFLLRYVTGWLVPHIPVTQHPWLAVNESALLFISIPEETLKVLLIAIIAFSARAFDEPMDGVVCGTAVGLGFAAHENLRYLVHADDWQVLAIVRGVLTVPFHGALGAIAGAYIAIARFGGALGAHRREHWVRARLILSAWLIPVVLHALFDMPLLTLRRSLDHGGVTHVALQVMGLFVGFGAIAIAVRLALRIAGHQKVWVRNSRTPAAAWRGIWGRLVVGAGLGFVGAALVVSAIRQGATGDTTGLFTLGIGAALMIIAVVIYGWGRKHLVEAAIPSSTH